MQSDSTFALVLFSGGQDSATCLAWALSRYERVETVGFDYGQRHGVELLARDRVREGLQSSFPWAGDLGADHRLTIPAFGEIGETAMTADLAFETGPGGLPTTFVPGRNLAFLVFAAALAWRRGAGALVGGMCGTDAAGYPDCREDAITAQAESLRLGMDLSVRVETPLMHRTKAQTWALAEEVGGRALVELILEDSHTCYRGDRQARHEWGYGCGTCPACVERAKGWTEYKATT